MQRLYEEVLCQIDSKAQEEATKEASKAQEEDKNEAYKAHDVDMKEAEVSLHFFNDLVIYLFASF